MANYTYEFDLAKFDFQRIQNWLSSTYWSPGIQRERVEKGFRASTLCVAAFEGPVQVGVARCLSDTTRFGYVADVIVDPGYRSKGIGREMVRRLMAHPLVVDVESWYLLTADAHGVYAGLGFVPYPEPGRLMFKRVGASATNAKDLST